MANRLTMDIITKIISEKKLFWISFAIIGYFCLLYLNAYFAKSDLVFSKPPIKYPYKKESL
ncbi:hypothetical protein FH721_22585 [Bacteroides thetaiotaomicron]|nr:hypothetical protein [Bacteroides thetaiotaomicron]MBL3954923.1 hypothetical protein [Bacteroides thetaiotaomicron]